ncbi:MAG: DUF4249 domain-containing protein [Bacteroidia bacterium]
MSLWLGSCIDQIELEIDPEQNPELLVVDGLITVGEGPFRIRIFKTAARGESRFKPALVGEAFVQNDLGQSENLIEEEPGIFLLKGETIRGEVGRSYQLFFRLSDGRSYQSSPEKLLPVSKIKRMYTDVAYEEQYGENGEQIFRSFAKFEADLTLSSLAESPFMRWEVERWWSIREPIRPLTPTKTCYIPDPPRREGIQLFDGRGITNPEWQGQEVASIQIDFRFYQKSFVNIYLYSLTAEAFEYWGKVDRVINQTGTVFDSPPAAVAGNVTNEAAPSETVLGYFGASAVDSFFHPVFRQDLAVYQNIQWLCALPEFRNFFGQRDPCNDCLDIPQSQVERPYFFDQ